jgi:hypothetical protein
MRSITFCTNTSNNHNIILRLQLTSNTHELILEIAVLYLNTGSFRRQFGIWKWSCTRDGLTLPKAKWAFAITWRPSFVNFSHFDLLLWNRLFKWHIWKVLYKACSFWPDQRSPLVFWHLWHKWESWATNCIEILKHWWSK